MTTEPGKPKTSMPGQVIVRMGQEFKGPAMTEAEPLRPVYREWSEHFERSLRLSAYPEAIKLCETDEDIPKLAKRPVRDWGYHLNTCQAMAMSRRQGEMIALKLEDMWCFESPLAYGLTGEDVKKYEAALKSFLDGNARYPDLIPDLEKARKWAHAFPRFEDYGKYTAIVTAPLMRAAFEPVLILLWVTPTQLSLVLGGIACQWGEVGVPCTMSGDGGCVHYVVPPMKTGDFWVSNPCPGDAMFAAKTPDELVVSIPLSKVEGLLTGMDYRAQHSGLRFPIPYDLRPEGWLPDSYTTLRETYGMGGRLINWLC